VSHYGNILRRREWFDKRPKTPDKITTDVVEKADYDGFFACFALPRPLPHAF
jgi:hypothetical protein